MNILYIEPYLAKSHLSWFEGLKKHSKHSFDLLSLPSRKWKWRMHGGAISISESFNNLDTTYDLIICSDFLNLPVFKSLSAKHIGKTPIIVYYHENQVSYPWSPEDKDISLNRDFHYYFINQTTSLSSSWNYFNSQYHLDSYIDGLSKYLSTMPDYKNLETLDAIKLKSSVLHLGLDFDKFENNKIKKNNHKPIILWNHRWEYDKNPELFFKALIEIKNRDIDFELLLLGERFSDFPHIFNEGIRLLKDNIITSEYSSFEDYKKWLWMADILPVTSNQDFFGISVMEAIYCKTYPILPNRLSYKELYDNNKNKENFYNDDQELVKKIIQAINSYKNLPDISKETNRFNWKEIIGFYDAEFEKKILEKN